MELGHPPRLAFGLGFDDLYRREGLLRLDSAFLEQLLEKSPDLHAQLEAARRDPAALASKQESELIVELAPHVEDFVGQLFGIEAELLALQARHSELAPLHAVKRKFVQRKLNGRKLEEALAIDGLAVSKELEAYFLTPFTEMAYASHVAKWMEAEAEHATQLQLASRLRRLGGP